MARPLEGVLAALVTPFADGGERVDEAALRALVESHAEAGLHGVVTCGSSGEFPALGAGERRAVLEATLAAAAGRMAVVAHVGATSTREALALARHAEAAGADALLVLPPYYAPPTRDEIRAYFHAVAEATALPLAVYNYPACAGVDLPPAFVAELAEEIPAIAYVKETSDDLSRLQLYVRDHADVVTALGGWDTLCFSALSLGTRGTILGTANLMPRRYVELYDHVRAGRLAEAAALWERMWPVVRMPFEAGFVATLKAGVRIAGHDAGDPRAPYRPLPEELVERLAEGLRSAGELVSA